MINLPPEQLGSFFLGAEYDHLSDQMTQQQVNYDSRDLTTHAVCVGMTGSGKTGLCIGLLEEAAIDKVPALIIDPKGDMTNLLLQFENLEASDFQDWINKDDATRKGLTIEDYAAATAEKWKKGLAAWGQGPDRIRLLKNAVDYTIYTPGSDSGVPVNILGSFAAPGIDFDSDAEMLHERIQGTVAALLGMIESKADPVRSREGILLSNLFEHHWRKNEDLDLTAIIKGVQNPPFTTLGVFDVETFYPEKDRFELAMDFNSLMASPQFRYWLQGDPLDIERMYFTAEGKPRHSIFYIAHLSDSERMFFVTLLLNSLISWMRKQSGTTSLRSLLYFDEIFGYFPPTANPPSKRPLMTLLKQARAFGVGSVLVTQNPVDIDYKGLSNAGTWFIGKLQTERDQQRVIQGLEGAIAESGNAANLDFGQLIASLKSRVFLMHNVHEGEPVSFHTRWAMSYLRGPMTRPQVKELMKARKALSTQVPAISPLVNTEKVSSPVIEEVNLASAPPSVDPSIEQRFFSVWKSASEAANEIGNRDLSIMHEPMVLAMGRVRFYDSKRGVDEVKDLNLLACPPDEFGRVLWDNAELVRDWERSVSAEPDVPDGVSVEYSSLPETMNTAKKLKKVDKEFIDWVYQNQRLIKHQHPELKLYQESGESDEAFRMRVQQAAREQRDEELDKVQERYEPKIDKIEDRIRKEEQELNEKEAEVNDRKTSEWIGMAETVFSIFRGRKRSLSSAATKRRMRKKAAAQLEATKEDIENLEKDLFDMEQELKQGLQEIRDKWDRVAEGIEHYEVKPRRADVKSAGVLLTWQPFWIDERGDRVEAKRG